MASRPVPPLGPYDQFGVISALRKSIKIDDPEQALARFRYTRPDTAEQAGAAAAGAARKPSLRAVRFESENLLDSAAACGLMWNEGRPLVDLTVGVAVTASDDDLTGLARVSRSGSLSNGTTCWSRPACRAAPSC